MEVRRPYSIWPMLLIIGGMLIVGLASSLITKQDFYTGAAKLWSGNWSIQPKATGLISSIHTTSPAPIRPPSLMVEVTQNQTTSQITSLAQASE